MSIICVTTKSNLSVVIKLFFVWLIVCWLIVFMDLKLIEVLFGLKFRKNQVHGKFARWSFISFTVMLITVIFMKIAQPMDSDLNFCVGLIQRISLLTFYAWIFSFAWILRKREAT